MPFTLLFCHIGVTDLHSRHMEEPIDKDPTPISGQYLLVKPINAALCKGVSTSTGVGLLLKPQPAGVTRNAYVCVYL